MIDENIKIAAFQETKLNDKKLADIPNFAIVRKDREKDKGGGLAFLVHTSIVFSPGDEYEDPHLEYLSIRVNNLKIINVYIPPTSSCSSGYKPSLAPLFKEDESLIVGDINSHDALWHSSLQDARGTEISEQIGDSNFGVLNTEHPTRLPANGDPTSPDISLASLSLLPYTTWRTQRSLGSDHLPIIISLVTDIKPQLSEDKTYINFRKANWDKFKTDTESEFSKLNPPNDVYKAEKVFRTIINKVSKICIPAGRIKEVILEIPSEALEKMKERDQLRADQPNSPEIATLNSEIEASINTHKRDKWRATVSDVNRKENPNKLFKLIKHLNGTARTKDNQSIKFKGKYISNAKKLANQFNKQYSSVVEHKSSKESRKITRQMKANKSRAPQTFTSEQTKAAIKQAKASKALGPDKISTLHLKHLGPLATDYLTDIFNISIKTSQIPSIWKMSTIIPLLKPNKEASESASYRPVSLLCPGIKIMERLILPSLNEHLPVPDVQHGFRTKHSTVTALNDFNQAIAEGFNQKKPHNRTVLLQLDLTKAFDMVSHDKLLKDLNQTTLPPELKRWFNTYLHGRQSRVNFRNETSSARNVRTGVPQGAVTSPVLFNFYLTKLHTPPDGISIIQYADNISVHCSGTNIPDLSALINSYVPVLTAFLRERELLVSAEKSTVTLFSHDTHEYNVHPKVYVDNKLVKLDHKPKLLGEHLSPLQPVTPRHPASI